MQFIATVVLILQMMKNKKKEINKMVNFFRLLVGVLMQGGCVYVCAC